MCDTIECAAGHKKISDEKASLINAIKLSERTIIELIDDVIMESNGNRQWANVASIDIQKGFMSLVRAVTTPEC